MILNPLETMQLDRPFTYLTVDLDRVKQPERLALEEDPAPESAWSALPVVVSVALVVVAMGLVLARAVA